MISIFYNELNNPLIDLIIIFILLNGFYLIGSIIISSLGISELIRSVSKQKYQNIIISINFVLLVSYPIFLFLEHVNLILFLYFVIIFLFGLKNIIRKIKEFKFRKHRNLQIQEKFLFVIIFFLLLLSLSPVTNADSLAYHSYIGKYLVDKGSFPVSIHFPHLRTMGSGEILIGLGLVANIEQFNSVIQMVGLISLVGIIKNTKFKTYMPMLLICSPIVIVFISSVKPQLFHIASNGLIFSIVIKNFYIIKKNIYNQKNIFFFASILITSITAKFSFVLSSFIVFGLIFYESLVRNFFLKFISILSLSLIIFYLPTLYWKWTMYGGNFLELIYSPFTTNLTGIDNFKNMLMNHGNEKPIYWILFPLHYKEITQTIGIGSILYFLLFHKFKENILNIIIVSFFIFIGFKFGQKQPRFFYEVYFWIIFLLCIKNETLLNNKFFKILILLQSSIFFLIISYGVVNLSPGLISKNFEQKILRKNADGYLLYKWSNFVLKEKKNHVIYFHRSISLAENEAISSNFLYYINPEDEGAKIYFDKLKELNPKYALVYKKSDIEKYKKCFIGLYQKKQNVGFHATRNPLARGNYYDGYIFEIDSKLFPDCIKK